MPKHGKNVTVQLTGQSIKASTGNLSPATNISLTGQQITLEQGKLTAGRIIEEIEKSDLQDIKKTVLVGIILKLAEQGLIKVEELISKAYETLINDPDLFNAFIEIVKSIDQSS